MDLNIRTHHTTLPPGFEAHAEKRLARIERLLPRVDDATIDVSYEDTRAVGHRHGVQITVRSAGAILRAEERAGDPETALDLAADVLARQASRHKKRLYDSHHPHGVKEAAADRANAPEPMARPAVQPDEEDEYVMGNIVRVKHFEAPVMTHEDALVQMDLLGHDFFVFRDATSQEFAVLYKRRDGQFGLLSPRRAG
jgi:putative sigma-54 modulation protein